MFKQVCKFLSVLLISNLIFTQAVLSKTQKDPNSPKKSIIQRLFCHKKPAEQKPSNNQPNSNQTNNQKPNIQKPTYDDHEYVTKYGVYFPDDVYDTYPQAQPKR